MLKSLIFEELLCAESVKCGEMRLALTDTHITSDIADKYESEVNDMIALGHVV